MDSSSSSPTICQRLINFILHKLSHLTGSARVPSADGSSRDPTNKPNGSEIIVEFKHTHIGAQTSRREGPILDQVLNKDGQILNKELRSGLDRKGLQEMEARGKGPKETVKKKKKEGDDDETIMVHENHHHEDEVILRPNPHWPLRSVTSNIDQKSDDYIESRKKAMGVDPQKS